MNAQNARAGADPYADDRFGRLSLTKEGLLKRDWMAFWYCYEAGISVAVTMAGGYARRIQDTVDIHFQTVTAAVEWQKKMANPVDCSLQSDAIVKKASS